MQLTFKHVIKHGDKPDNNAFWTGLTVAGWMPGLPDACFHPAQLLLYGTTVLRNLG